MTPRERLQYLADHVLSKVRPSKFDMWTWRCGSVGCAIGHGAADPVLQAEGLSIHESNTPQIVGVGVVGYGGLAIFFGISYEGALNLFHPARYSQRRKPGPRTVRTRILKYIAEHPET